MRAQRQPFAALNAALFSDGFVLALEPGVVLDRPVEIVHFSETAERSSFHLRNAVLLGAGSKASLIETDWDENRSSAAGEIRNVEVWKNAVTDLRCAAGSALTHIRVQSDDLDAINFALARVVLERGARYESFALDARRAAVALRHRAALCRARCVVPARRRLLLARRAGGDDRDLRRSRGAVLHHARALQGRGRGPRARRIHGPHRGQARCAENRRAANEPQPAFEPARRGRHQARARHPGRRREMQPRRHDRRSRRGRALLSARPRHSRGRGAAPPDRGVRRRRARRRERCRRSRRISRSISAAGSRGRIGHEGAASRRRRPPSIRAR